MRQPIDPGLAIVVATFAILAFFGVAHLWQRRRSAERRAILEASARIELPIVSELRRSAIVLSITGIPLALWIAAFIALDGEREHALLVVIGALAWTALGIAIGMAVAGRHAVSGALVLDGHQLVWRDGRSGAELDLAAPFTVQEWECIPIRGPHLVGVGITQAERQLTFFYPPWGARVVAPMSVTTSAPFAGTTFGAEAAALHARLLAHPSCRRDAPMQDAPRG